MADPQAMSVAAYRSMVPEPAIDLSAGDKNHTAQQSTPITPAPSSHPMAARTDINLNRLTGRERVNSVEPWTPFDATSDGWVATPAPARSEYVMTTSIGFAKRRSPITPCGVAPGLCCKI